MTNAMILLDLSCQFMSYLQKNVHLVLVEFPRKPSQITDLYDISCVVIYLTINTNQETEWYSCSAILAL